MTATMRTLVFIAAAAVFAGGAWLTQTLTAPAKVVGFERVGKPFFPDFKDPVEAAGLRVAAYDADSDRENVFSVEKKDGQWRIPSHNNYPAEAGKRLAETAASVMNVERTNLASRRETDFKRFGVVDPLDEDAAAGGGQGKRLTLFDDSGKELVDLIIGNKVEDQAGQFYVRRPDEKETYRAAVDVKLSTKFPDWIEPDLLKLERNDLRKIRISDVRVVRDPKDPERGVIDDQVVTELSRDDSAADWKLASLDEKTEKLKTTGVNTIVDALDDLELLGVRPKPNGFDDDLKVKFPEEMKSDRRQMQAFVQSRAEDLMDRGFRVVQISADEFLLMPREGQLKAATSEGLQYWLYFGSPFSGSLEDIEIGSGDAANADSQVKDKSDEGDGDSVKDGNEPKTADDEDDSPDKRHGRYLFVRVEFDPGLIGEEPRKPVEPEKPKPEEKPADKPAADAVESDDPATKQDSGDEKSENDPSEDNAGAPATPDGSEDQSDAKSADEPEQPDSQSSAETTDAGSDDAKPKKNLDATDADKTNKEKKADKTDKPKSDPQAEYEAAKRRYDSDLAKYKDDVKEWEKKVKKGRDQAAQLNNRFRDWYYVISETQFEELKVPRKDLVEPKASNEPDPKASNEPDPKASSEPDPKASSEPDPKASSETDPKPSGKPTPEASGESQPKASSETDPKASGESQPKSSDKPAPKADAEQNSKPESKPESGAGDDPEPGSGNK